MDFEMDVTYLIWQTTAPTTGSQQQEGMGDAHHAPSHLNLLLVVCTR